MKKGWLILVFCLLAFVPRGSYAAEAEAATTSTLAGGTPATAAQLDSDGDGFTDQLELEAGYDPFSADPNPLPKTIKVSLKEQRLRYYTGQYLVKEIKVSTGIKSMPTPRGNFEIIKKLPVVHYKGEGFDFPNTKWNMKFKPGKNGSYYIHGAYWHNAFGTPRSHGCVNVSYKDMEPLYRWAPTNTPVVIE